MGHLSAVKFEIASPGHPLGEALCMWCELSKFFKGKELCQCHFTKTATAVVMAPGNQLDSKSRIGEGFKDGQDSLHLHSRRG